MPTSTPIQTLPLALIAHPDDARVTRVCAGCGMVHGELFHSEAYCLTCKLIKERNDLCEELVERLVQVDWFGSA